MRAGNGELSAGSSSHLTYKKSQLTTPVRLFIIDGVISLPIAVLTFFFLPDQPHNTRVWYLNARVSCRRPLVVLQTFVLITPQDKEIALQRVQRIGRASREGFSKDKILKIFSRWHIWVFPLMTV
jgi:ACS family pantothenate transporter-like MFS transporter